MELPDLNRMWETFVRIGPKRTAGHDYIRGMRHEVTDVIATLRAAGLVDWYCILVHDHTSGVPTVTSDPDAYWHIRFALLPGKTEDELAAALPPCCLWLNHMPEQNTRYIGGLDASLMQNPDVAKQWQLIGLESELMLHVVSLYREDAHPGQVRLDMSQYAHFVDNMAQQVPQPPG